MRRYLPLVLIALLALPSALVAQEPAKNGAAAQITQLEGELSKLRDTSSEAADVMVKLVEAYYAEGRVFGLIRVGQAFVTHHTNHPQHKAIMLRLADGLQATSRNKELTALCRQFLTRYPDDAACGQIEITLATTLDQLDDRLRTAEAYDAVWQRQGNNPVGLRAGVRAFTLYNGINNKDGFTRAATVAESMFRKLPVGESAERAGLDAVYTWQRINEWAKSAVVGQELLKKDLPKDKLLRANLHLQLAQADFSIQQRANGIEHLKKSRALVDSRELLSRIIAESASSNALPPQLQPLVDEYLKKYPTRQDRFTLKSYLPAAYLRANDKPKALALMRELLVEDAVSNGIGSAFVRENGTEPANLADTEKTLLDAIGKNRAQAGYLRYTLALEVYRDRLKNLDRARAVGRELLAQSPTNDGYTSQVISWLLFNPEDENAFKADVARVIAAREANGNFATVRNSLTEWLKQAKGNKELKDRVTYARAELDKAEQSPLVQTWIATENNAGRISSEARLKLLEPAQFAKLNDVQARQVLVAQAESVRYTGSTESRRRAVDFYAQAVKRFPQDYLLAQAYLESASDLALPEVAKDAATHMLKFEPLSNNNDTWRRLLLIADKIPDPALVKSAWQWLQKSQQTYGPDTGNSSYIGDILSKHGMAAEAQAYWQRTFELTPNSYECRQCADRLLATMTEAPAKIAFLRKLAGRPVDYHGYFEALLANELLKSGDYEGCVKTLADSAKIQLTRINRPWGIEEGPIQNVVDVARAGKNAKSEPIADDVRLKLLTAVRDLQVPRPSGFAATALLDLTPPESLKPMARLLAYQAVTTLVLNDSYDWDTLSSYVQGAMARKDYTAVATLSTGMLANIPNVDATRKKTGRDLVGQSYARMGAEGLSIDESSPIAPLLQAALYLRLGDDRLAFDTYVSNRKLFDEHREQMPVDLILFVCENHIAAGGDENHERAEDILRNWIIKQSEAKDIDEATKASVQLLLAKNFFKAQRYDVARGEYQTVVNRYAKTAQATEAEFGIGESYMAQKVYDQAELVFEKLSNSKDRDTVVRAEFLRGVLANRRGDRDQARDIFRLVLDRVPNVELANQALFNLAEVYGAEQRYMDQLELLRTVGRLGRASQRWHAPGFALAIVVQDSDLGISRGHARIPVRVVTEPGGDEETIYLYSGGAGKGLFRADLETRLGSATKNDKVLQLTGKDTIKCDYPEQFKAEFKSVPLSDAEIKIAADAKFEVASTKIIDEQEETFSQRLERENRQRDQQRSEDRPKNQIKPGNLVYLRVQDADRDLGEETDSLTVKLVATSGDQVQVKLTETGPHTGVFEATAQTGDLPAGALASDTSIDHSPLMAIDKDPKSFWLSEPDGVAPKFLSVDLKDLRTIDHVVFESPKPDQQIAVRGELFGSNDGRFWFPLGSNPAPATADNVAGEYAAMTRSVYEGNYANFSEWTQVVNLSKNSKPIEQVAATDMSYTVPEDLTDEKVRQKPHAVIWHGKLVQPRAGAARLQLVGARTAVAIDGRLALALGENNRTVDVWLEQGTHDLTIFCATATNLPTVGCQISREDHAATQVVFLPFSEADFDLKRAEAKPATIRKPATIETADGKWDFRFEPIAVRHVKFVIREFLGEAVAVNHVTVAHEAEQQKYIPTDADVLSLATNNVLEIAAGDKVVATYSDEVTQFGSGRSQLLTANLQSTYYNASTATIAYDFVRQSNGQVQELRKELVRIDPGQRVIVEITDYDADTTEELDTIKFQVSVNNGEKVEYVATETEQRPGVFTKEIDTSAEPAEKKLHIKLGDRIYCSYLDEQNTFPGHSVDREAIVFAVEPSDAKVRVVESRYLRPKTGVNQPPRVVYLPSAQRDVSNVAFEVPFTVEVIDPDAARDARSKVLVQLQTTSGAAIEIECVVARDPALTTTPTAASTRKQIEEGRFVGQVLMQLGGKESPDIVPIVVGMPRNLLGGPKLPEEEAPSESNEEPVVTRVLNVSGKDIVTATYNDQSRAAGMAENLSARGRLIANATLSVTDRDYDKDLPQLHVGEKLYLRIADADLDTTDERDRATVVITTQLGEKETLELEETLAHSGLFTGSVLLKPKETPTAGNFAPDAAFVETYFGDQVKVTYVDKAASTESGELELMVEVPVVVGTDGLVAAFSKTFGDETLAVETQFHIAESYFELFKSHQKLARNDEQKNDLEAGRRVLREVMEDYPNPKYVPRIAYLLGQFAQELKQWDEAIDSYQMIVKQYPDNSLAADAQYKLAQCYEESQDFEQALEAYVTLAATYPKSPLIANVMIRISEYFYKAENFEVAAQVGEKFMERFEGHEWAARMAFRVGQCYYKGENYNKAGMAFDRFAKIFPDDGLCADSLFWAGESYRMANNTPEAFRRYNRCRWDHPSSESAKYARGRLALPEMLRQFEVEANVDDKQ
ncbi:MAG: tetratricopeptide repeat protein [Planctomycetaceae bacterium]|nr:tetratricopeptide repeat protein [Planctomycetaceae bacterium]